MVDDRKGEEHIWVDWGKDVGRYFIYILRSCRVWEKKKPCKIKQVNPDKIGKGTN